ncbi:MAG: endolytic transglycosylase MltG [Pseudomonadota bacterium]
MRKLILLLLLTLAGLAGWLLHYATTLPDGGGYPLAFSVERGATLKSVSQDLHTLGALEQPWAFVLLARLSGQESAIKAGSYGLEAPASPLDLLRKITAGDTLLGKLTIVEGWTFRQMRQAVDAHGGLRHDTAGMTDEALLVELGMTDRNAEGLFFPDTYFFDQGSADLALYRRAQQAMARHLETQWAARATNLPYRTPYEALVMASIVEKETGAAEERPLIAAVFINRLRIGMRLQTDPTVIYGLGPSFDGNLRKVDLLTDTPYNTYTRAGLPPGPIALPGLEALRAALNPEPSRALYFVAKGNGRHVFSETLEAHNRAVNRYQR